MKAKRLRATTIWRAMEKSQESMYILKNVYLYQG